MKNIRMAIDIGNTHTDIGIIDTTKPACLRHETLSTVDIASRFLGVWESVLGAVGSEPLEVVICSVVAGGLTQVESIVSHHGNVTPRRFENRGVSSIQIDYADPAVLGVDRVADCLYANRTAPGENAIIVDAGTAVKIDFLEKGERFRGGTIFPGILTQLRSLHKGTDLLPEVALSDLFAGFPGNSTGECIGAGVRFGVAGAINGVVTAYKKKWGEESLVLATGGTWPFTADLIEFPYRYDPDMTLIGIGLFE